MRRAIGSLFLAGVAVLMSAALLAERSGARAQDGASRPEKQNTDKPTADSPTADKPTADGPTAERPSVDKSKSEKPAGDKPRATGQNPKAEASKSQSSNPQKSPATTKPGAENANRKLPPEKSRTENAKPSNDKGGSLKTENPKAENSKTENPKGEPARPGVAITAGREAAAMTFARVHHPELADLLEQLKKGNKAEYERAIRDLFQQSERLAKIKERFPDRYDEAVAAWKLDSRIRLLSARMMMSENPALEAEMRELLRQRAETRLTELKEERTRLTARLDKVEEEIAALESDPTGTIQRELQKVRRVVSEQSRTLKNKPGTEGDSRTKAPGKAKDRD